MDKLVFILPLMLLASCSGQQSEGSNRYFSMKKDNEKQGFAEVGKMPDGKILYVKEVDLGHTIDRVYFTSGSITAVEDCGKNCTNTVTTVVR